MYQGNLFRGFRFKAEPGVLAIAYPIGLTRQMGICPVKVSLPAPKSPHFFRVNNPTQRPDGLSNAILLAEVTEGLIPGSEYIIWMKVQQFRPLPVSLNFTQNSSSAKDYFSSLFPNPQEAR